METISRQYIVDNTTVQASEAASPMLKMLLQDWSYRLGDLDPDHVAGVVAEWEEICTPEEAETWIEVGVFQPWAAKELIESGLTPTQVDVPCTSGLSAGRTMGYAFANGDITIEEIK